MTKKKKLLIAALALLLSAAAAQAQALINETNFPDEIFREYVKKFDKDEDGKLSVAEIEAVTSISVYGRAIADLKGIEYFTALTELRCFNNHLTSLDVSKNTALTYLNCRGNKLTSLDVSKNMALTELRCFNNQLTSLDVSKNTALTELRCNENRLISLDVSKNTELMWLWCSNNYIPEAEVPAKRGGAYSWKTLPQYIFDTNTGVAINKSSFPDEKFRNWALAQVWGVDGAISTDDISKITSIDVSDKGIANLKGIEYFTKLTYLDCSNNQFTSFDVSKNTALEELICSDNHLTSLDISNNTELTKLWCINNHLTALDVSKNTKLTTLYCSDNQLTSLDVLNNTALIHLVCSNNYIPKTKVPKKRGDVIVWETKPQR